MSVNINDTTNDVDGNLLYGGRPYTGEVVETTRDGTVIAVSSYTHGYEDGPFRQWYPDGTRRAEGQSRLGVGVVGVWREWHPNGQLALEHGFSDAGRQLFLRRWDESGALVEDKTY